MTGVVWHPPAWQPLVSVVIPALDEGLHIAAAVRSALVQDYPSHLVEIIVADGGSSDATRDIVSRIAAIEGRVRLIDNPGRNQAAGLNHGIRAARGAVIARLDAHAAWSPAHVRRCVALLDRSGADNVGGTMEAIGETPVGTAVAVATRTRLGSGGAEYRVGGREREVDTVYLGCFRREVFDRVGLFDESLPIHEDYELNRRIRSSGGKIIFSPSVPTQYTPRDTWRSLARQYFRYGRGKVRASRRTSGLIRLPHLLPPALVLIGFAVPAGLTRRLCQPAVAGTLGAYAGVCVAEAVRATAGAPAIARVRVALIFPVIHLSWGFGFWAGCAEVAIARLASQPYSTRPSVRRTPDR